MWPLSILDRQWPRVCTYAYRLGRVYINMYIAPMSLTVDNVLTSKYCFPLRSRPRSFAWYLPYWFSSLQFDVNLDSSDLWTIVIYMWYLVSYRIVELTGIPILYSRVVWYLKYKWSLHYFLPGCSYTLHYLMANLISGIVCHQCHQLVPQHTACMPASLNNAPLWSE